MHQQEILQTIQNYYADDKRILAVVLFGSLARGNWDKYSDIDLDIVIANEVVLDVCQEFMNLCAFIKQEHQLEAIMIADDDEGDIVLSNLVQMSIRYHPLHDTKPAILESMKVLRGTLSYEEIKHAGNSNRKDIQPDIESLVNVYIRYILEVHNRIVRQELWLCLELLHRMRNLMMQIFTMTHGGERSIQFFEKNASVELQSHLRSMIPQPELSALTQIKAPMIASLETHLDAFTNGKYQLTAEQHDILRAIKQRDENEASTED